MKIISETTLDEFRHAQRCEWCQTPCAGLDPHHYLIHRGFGGGSRLDIRPNLVALCRGCHVKAERKDIIPSALLRIVADREQAMTCEVEAVVKLLWRLPKDATTLRIDAEVQRWTFAARALLWKTLALAWKP